MSKEFFAAIQARRTIYTISAESPVSDQAIEIVIKEAVKHTPSAFNSQSGRVILLLGKEHGKLWEITKGELKKVVPADGFTAAEEKINNCFACGYGTVLFFEDMTVVEGLQAQFPLYKDNFPVWSNHSAGMLQLVVWTALELEGFGASLQHYNPLIDQRVKETWQVPESWKLLAQMPFGKPTAPPAQKEFSSLSERVKVYK